MIQSSSFHSEKILLVSGKYYFSVDRSSLDTRFQPRSDTAVLRKFINFKKKTTTTF